ncbi:MAG: ORF6N domain-containing protein [Ignavibacteriales bacterium]|nr:ORF6N domain-containing protein [Ignavibacteriales bacterium]
MKDQKLIPYEVIERKIFLLRNQKVMIDSDLASLYGIPTKTLLQSVKRNIDRFPLDFMFQLSKEEFSNLRSHFVTSSYGGRRYLPYVFTEQGVSMLSSVLRSPRAVHVNIHIMRAFVKLREIISTHKELAKKLEEMEKKYDAQFKIVFDAIRELMIPPEPTRKEIGFRIKEKRIKYLSRN